MVKMRQLLDETTSENSMIPQTSQKVGRKKVLMNENERPQVIEEENENIDKLKSTINER